MKKQIIKSVLATVLAIAFLMLASFLYLSYETGFKKTVIAELKKVETGHSVIFQEVGCPVSFGPSRVQIILENEKGAVVGEVEDRIYNDGKILQKGNISVVWTDTGANVTLSGEEQEDKFLKLQYRK